MNPAQNPYRPGAGTQPKTLAGRTKEIEKANVLFERVKYGNPQRSLMLYGLRGVGKTVLLNEYERIAESQCYLTEHIEMSENDDFRRVIAKACRKVLLKVSKLENAKDKCISALGILKAFSLAIPDGPELKIDVEAAIGSGDSGDLDSDLVDLLVSLGQAAKDLGRPICFTLDEVQYLNKDAVGGLISASHRITQKELPVVFVCAGLPQIAALSGDARSYAERLFEFIPIGELKDGADEEALVGPAISQSVEYTREAKELILKESKAYPYFIQEFGKHTWDLASESPIKEEDALNASIEAIKTLDGGFFKMRMDRATTAERKFMKAMASIGSGVYKTNDVATAMNKKIKSIGPVRATLISKGFVYSPQHGEIAFTVPLFDEYIRRSFKIDNQA
jgi:AAA+ ATPase superfamily predicted ATPase